MAGFESDELAGSREGRRAGRREANLRVLNSRIAESQADLALEAAPPLTLLCECANDECNESIDLPHAVFAELREQSTRFAVVDGHVLHEVEQVVDRNDGWIIVEKHGVAAREARRILE